MAIEWTNSTVSVAGTEVHLRRGGEGSPVVVLHRDIGSPDNLPFYDFLAAHHDVIVPNHPGYGSSPRAEWLANVRDVAALYRTMLGDLGLGSAALVGLGFGGWIAAEMACFAPHDTPQLVLAGAMGIKPPVGDICDRRWSVTSNTCGRAVMIRQHSGASTGNARHRNNWCCGTFAAKCRSGWRGNPTCSTCRYLSFCAACSRGR